MRDTSKNVGSRLYNHLSPHDGVCIVTNGEYTEINYFHSLFKHYKSKYTIKEIRYVKENSPHLLIDKAIKISACCHATYTWVVFDSDSATFIDREKGSKNLDEAINYATRHNVHVALSCMAFEVWLVAHYTDIPIHDSFLEIKSNLDKYILSKGGKTKYEKNSKDIIEKYFIKYLKEDTLCSRSSYQTLKKNFIDANNHGYLWDFGNYTTVWDLIEFLFDPQSIS